MSISELIKRINLIISFIIKMNSEVVPYNIQKIFIKSYAQELNFNLPDTLIDNLVKTSFLKLTNK